ncbi:uncharacterized protein LOC129570813, partial [Sitodiplosis mosellana]|uniref:uncharacterized protein LOC129570813 n=1 Tax=Sitodiplosis mosellana TaxID=263140 RepID=UPI002444289E
TRFTKDKLHSHEENCEDLIKSLAALNEIKKKCSDLQTVACGRRLAKAKDIFTEVMIDHQDTKLNFDRIERTLQILKKGALPPSPVEVSEICEAFDKKAVFDSYGSTLQTVDLNGEKLENKYAFFDGAVDNGDEAFCVFSSKVSLQLIEAEIPPNKRHILMDATFRTVPIGPFNQLLILYMKRQKKVFPFAYILMSRKTTKAYRSVFEFIDENIIKLGDVLSFTTDYEMAMRNALKELFPDVRRFACYFHFCQAVKRRAWQTPGLVALIRNNAKVRSIYYQLQCLPLLPPEHIESEFKRLRKEAMELPQRADLFLFMRYFNDQWIKKEGPLAISVA